MKTVHFAFTLLALSMVAAFPLIGESFAQTAPTAVKAEFTGPNQITIEFSEPVTGVTKNAFGDVTIFGTLADGTSVDDNATRNVLNTAHVEERKIYRLIIDGKPLGTDARATIVLNPTPVDASEPVNIIKNRASSPEPLAQVPDFPIFDGQAPQIKSVRIIDNDNDGNPINTPLTAVLKPQIEIVYTESVVATTANYAYRGLNVNGIAGVSVDAQGAPIAVAAAVDTGVLTAPTHILTLSGPPLAPETTGFINFVMTSDSDGDPTGLIDIANTGEQSSTTIDPVVNATPNVLVATDGHPLTNHFVEAGQIPTVVSATFIDNPDSTIEDNINRIAIKFSEAISRDDVSYDNFTSLLLNDGTSRNPDVTTVIAQGTGDDGDSTIILTYLGDEITTGATGTINIAPIIDNTGDTPVVSSLKDAAGNAVKKEMAFEIKDGQKPKITSAKITGPNEISFEFSERVVGVKRSNFGDFYVGTDTTGPDADKRNLTILNTAGEIIKFRVSSDEIDTSAQGIITTSLDLNDDDTGETAIANITDDATPSNTIVALTANHPVNPGQTPKIMSAKIVSPTQVHIVFTETIQLNNDLEDGSNSNTDASDYVTFYKNNERGATEPTSVEIYNDVANSAQAPGNTIVLTFPSDEFNPNDTGRIAITDDIISGTNNGSGDTTLLKFVGVERYPVEAGQTPTIKSIAITAPDMITVTFSEPVQAKGENFTKFTLTGGTDITPGETLSVSADVNVLDHLTLASEDNVIMLTIENGDLPTDAVGTINVAPTVDDGEMDSLRDSDGIFVNAVTNYMVTDGQSPNLTSATLTAPNQITIKFSEKVNAVWSDFTNLKVESVIRNITGFSGSGSDTMTLTVGGSAIASSLDDGDVRIDIKSSETDEDDKQSSLVDLVGNPLMLTDTQAGSNADAGAVLKDGNPRTDTNADFLDWPIAQGQIPTIMSASITDSNEITIKFSIPVNAVQSDFTFTLNGENTSRNITSISGSGTDTIILTISGEKIAPEAEGTIDIAGTVIGSVSGAALDAQNDHKVDAGQVPTVSVASITGPNTVTVTFDVSVNVSETNFTFTVDGESKPRTVDSAIQTITDGVVEITLVNTDTDDVNDMPANATGKININGVKNTNTGIVMESITNEPVLDGQAPAVSSAKITDRNDDNNNTVTIKFTERVYTTFSDYSNFVLTAGTGITANESREIIGFDHPTTGDTVVLYIAGNAIPVDATGTIDIAGNVTDLSGNTMNAVSALQVEAGQIPTIVSAMFTGPNTISIKFSEPVMANVNHFKDFKVTSPNTSLDDAPRNISIIGGNETDTILVTVQGTFDIDTTATIDIEKEITDLANPPNELAQREDDYEVVFDPRPSIMSAEITGSNQITIKFSEPVTTSSGDYVDLKITYDNPADDTDKITR
ncbi:MAG: hypothetical protein OXC46_07665, partial [Thaumarchaeota archaeon]|nr:hypothetical protein [Nitrososphaerota archaeon]